MKRSGRGVFILAAGAAIQALTGIPAAWGVFHEPVAAEYGLNEVGAEWVFSLIIGVWPMASRIVSYTINIFLFSAGL